MSALLYPQRIKPPPLIIRPGSAEEPALWGRRPLLLYTFPHPAYRTEQSLGLSHVSVAPDRTDPVFDSTPWGLSPSRTPGQQTAYYQGASPNLGVRGSYFGILGNKFNLTEEVQISHDSGANDGWRLRIKADGELAYTLGGVADYPTGITLTADSSVVPFHAVAFTVSGDGGTLNVYHKALPDGAWNTYSVAIGTMGGTPSQITLRGLTWTGQLFLGTTVCSYWFGDVLTFPEVQALAADPWLVVRPRRVRVPAGGGGGITGAGAATLPSLTASASGSVAVQGTGTPTIPTLTSTGTGAVAVQGAGAATIPALTSSGAAQVEVQGSGGASVPALTSSASGAVSVEGDGAASVPSLTASGSGVVAIQGTGAATVPSLTSSGAGGQPTTTGSGAPSVPALTASGAGSVAVQGAGAADIPALTSSGAAQVEVQGAGAATLPGLTASGAGGAATGGGALTPTVSIDYVSGDSAPWGNCTLAVGTDVWLCHHANNLLSKIASDGTRTQYSHAPDGSYLTAATGIVEFRSELWFLAMNPAFSNRLEIWSIDPATGTFTRQKILTGIANSGYAAGNMVVTGTSVLHWKGGGNQYTYWIDVDAASTASYRNQAVGANGGIAADGDGTHLWIVGDADATGYYRKIRISDHVAIATYTGPGFKRYQHLQVGTTYIFAGIGNNETLGDTYYERSAFAMNKSTGTFYILPLLNADDSATYEGIGGVLDEANSRFHLTRGLAASPYTAVHYVLDTTDPTTWDPAMSSAALDAVVVASGSFAGTDKARADWLIEDNGGLFNLVSNLNPPLYRKWAEPTASAGAGTVTTAAIDTTNQSTRQLGLSGELVDAGGLTCTERGFRFDQSNPPTTEVVVAGTTTGVFSTTRTSLAPGVWYCQAYSKFSDGSTATGSIVDATVVGGAPTAPTVALTALSATQVRVTITRNDDNATSWEVHVAFPGSTLTVDRANWTTLVKDSIAIATLTYDIGSESHGLGGALPASTQIAVAVVVENADGIGTSSVVSATTSAGSATITPQSVTKLAQLNLNATNKVARKIHGSYYLNGYIWGSTRSQAGGAYGTMHEGGVVRVDRTDYTTYDWIQFSHSLWPGSYPAFMEDMVHANSAMWVAPYFYGDAATITSGSGHWGLYKIDPSTLAVTEVYAGTGRSSSFTVEVLLADATHLFFTMGASVYVMDFATETVTNRGNVASLTNRSYHSGSIDSTNLYLVSSSGDDPSAVEVVVITKANLVSGTVPYVSTRSNFVKSTDDMTVNSGGTYLFTGPEQLYPAAQFPSNYHVGYGYGSASYRISDGAVTYLGALSANDPPAEQSFASLVFGAKLLDLRTNQRAYVLNISAPETWTILQDTTQFVENEYLFDDLGTMPADSTPNEAVRDEDGNFHSFVWDPAGGASALIKYTLPAFAAGIVPVLRHHRQMMAG